MDVITHKLAVSSTSSRFGALLKMHIAAKISCGLPKSICRLRYFSAVHGVGNFSGMSLYRKYYKTQPETFTRSKKVMIQFDNTTTNEESGKAFQKQVEPIEFS